MYKSFADLESGLYFFQTGSKNRHGLHDCQPIPSRGNVFFIVAQENALYNI